MIDEFLLNTNNTKSIYEVKTLLDQPRRSLAMQSKTSFLPEFSQKLSNWIWAS